MAIKIRNDILERILENQAAAMIQALLEEDIPKANGYFDAGCATAKKNGKNIDHFLNIVAGELQKMVR